MKTITKSIKITEDQEQFLISNFSNVNQGVKACIEKVRIPDYNEDKDVLKQIRLYSRRELKGKFTREEWLFFIDSLNGSLTEARFRCNAGALMYHCHDAAELEGTANKWGVDLPVLLEKIQKTLTGAQVEALYTFIEGFWNKEDRDLEKTANELV
ncbi:MAG: hypothetical protein AB9922_12450 [Bacteroidales bacterium]